MMIDCKFTRFPIGIKALRLGSCCVDGNAGRLALCSFAIRTVGRLWSLLWLSRLLLLCFQRTNFVSCEKSTTGSTWTPHGMFMARLMKVRLDQLRFRGIVPFCSCCLYFLLQSLPVLR